MSAHRLLVLRPTAGAWALLTGPARAVWWRLEIRSLEHWHHTLLLNHALPEAELCSGDIEAARVKLAMAEAGR